MNKPFPIHYKGTTYNLGSGLEVWGEEVPYISLCCMEGIDKLMDRLDVSSIIRKKDVQMRNLNLEVIRQFIEKETDEKINSFKPVRVNFDFSDPEEGDCSVDMWLDAGEVFGGFTVHLRFHGEEPRIEMCGLS